MNTKVNARTFRDAMTSKLMELGHCNRITDFGGQSVCITHNTEIFEDLCLEMVDIVNNSLVSIVKEIRNSAPHSEFNDLELSLDTTEEEELKFKQFVELVDTPLSSTAKLEALAKRPSPFA